jgi:hypothetical protein
MNNVDKDSAVKNPVNGWDFFDRIYCISLEEREDRRRAAAFQFSRVGLDSKVEFVIVRRHPFNAEQGIFESHMTCLRKGLKAGAERIAVFEDDILFDNFNPDRFRKSIDFISNHPDWQVLLFGALISSSRKTEEPTVRKVRYRSLAHAYALNRPYAETLVCKTWEGTAFDTLFRPLTDHVYAVNPMFSFQGNLSTDNRYLGLDRFRRWCGGLKRIQKINEFYLHHIFEIIFAHVLILFLLLFFLIRQFF